MEEYTSGISERSGEFDKKVTPLVTGRSYVLTYLLGPSSGRLFG